MPDIDDSVRASRGDFGRRLFGVAGTVDHCGGSPRLIARMLRRHRAIPGAIRRNINNIDVADRGS
jgi:hypothetical protein